MIIDKHSITSRIDVEYLFEYLRDLQLYTSEYQEYKKLLIDDIQHKEELPDFRESIRKVLDALVGNISDKSKQNKVKDFIQNKIS